MSESRPEVRHLVPRGMTHPGALKVCVGLLACSAVLIAVDRRGVVDGVAKEVAGWAGLGLALAGVLYLIHIWWAARFRVSIGRFMLVVALAGVLLQGFLAYRRWMMAGLRKPSGIPSAFSQMPPPPGGSLDNN
jgi:hypothetical protein